MVDHNEKNQAVDGIENADILEIIPFQYKDLVYLK